MKVRIEVEEPGGKVHRLEFDLVDICMVQLPCAAELTRAMEARDLVQVGFRGRVHKIRAETHDLQVFAPPEPERIPPPEDCIPCDDGEHGRCSSNVHPCACAMRGHRR